MSRIERLMRAGRAMPSTPGRMLGAPGLLVDLVAILGLIIVGLTVFAGTFDGWGFLVVGGVGALVGLASSGLVLARRWPWPVVPLPAAVISLLILPPLCLVDTAAGPVPAPASAAVVADTAIGGWMDLLTTLPPVDSTGRLAILPYLLALAGAAVGLLIARRTRAAYWPGLGPALTFAGAAALGLAQVGGLAPRGLLAALLGIAWGALRRRRLQVVARGGGRQALLTGGGLLAGTALLSTAIAPMLGGGPDRVVLRERVSASVDLSAQPSPLSSFRRFRPAFNDLADQQLLQVTGLPPGTPVRFAVLDHYGGTVWTAGSGTAAGDGSGRFLRVGARIPVAGNGTPVTARVTVGEAYAAVPDLRIWLPAAGSTTRVRFEGTGTQEREEAMRYNTGTGAALVLGGLAAGDTYLIEGFLPDPVVPEVVQAATPTVDGESSSICAGYLAATSPGSAGPAATVAAVAARLRDGGTYTDGAGKESVFLPGHSVGRLTGFLATTPAGNDEQYAAALALCASAAGLPARVVLGAVPDRQGVVRGRDVRAWVQVRLGPDRWWELLPASFMPDRGKRPTLTQVTDQDKSQAAIVPPPSALRPPSTLDVLALDNSSSGRLRDQVENERWAPPAWLVRTLQAGSVPVGGLLLWTLVVTGAKAVRRAGRRRTGPAAQRVAAAWDEVIDTLRDAGREVSTRHTRAEAVAAVPDVALARFAAEVDRLGYGPVPVGDQDAVDVWSQVRRLRAQIGSAQPWLRRWRSAVSLASARPAPVGGIGVVEPSLLQRRRVLGEPAGIVGGPADSDPSLSGAARQRASLSAAEPVG